jgi:hypothetical protein
MRIFQTYRAFLHKSQLPFKEVFSFSDNFLKDNGYEYREILFAFETHKKQDDLIFTETFLKKYPYWKIYQIPTATEDSFHKFTNAPEIDDIVSQGSSQKRNVLQHEPVDIKNLQELLSKVPRPINLPECTVRFEGIDWLHSGGEGFLSFSRSIWPSGSNYVVFFDVEITEKRGSYGILDDSKVVAILNQQFFNSIGVWNGRRCELTEEEEGRIVLLKREVEPVIRNFRSKTRLEQKRFASFKESLVAVMDAHMTRFTINKPLKAFFKGWDYKYEQVGFFSVSKIVKHGFKLEVIIYYKPGAAERLTREISISGLYFNYGLASDQILNSSQEIIDSFIADCKHVVEDAEQMLVESLFQSFGDTPVWYFNR